MTSSQADSPANQSVSPEPDLPKMTRGGSGPSSSESFAWYDPDTSSWKTSQGSLLPEWETYSETWPRAGMTRSGKAFRLRLLAPRIYGGESSSWPRMLHTPTATANQAAPLMRDRDPGRFWPTPAAQEAGGSDEWLETLETVDGEPLEPNQRWYDPETGKHVQQGLSRAVRLWPSPSTRDRGSDPPNREGGMSLEATVRTDPTHTGQLNPTWVEWLMGFPEGWTDLEDSETP